jgi:predicted GNAT family N-acyltransferase
MNIIVTKVVDSDQLNACFEIRKKVFVEEQQVDEREEYDEFEEHSTHYIALDAQNNQAIGTCRWRVTKNGVKLERFAVLKDFRDHKVGKALLQECLIQIPKEHKHLYLHAQIQAMPFYAKAGFEKVGEEFVEANIRHYTMELWRE